MKTILLISPNTQPIPPINGGAIATLINFLIEENEVEHKVNFVVLTKYNKVAKEISKKFKYTKIIYYKNNNELNILEKVKYLPFNLQFAFKKVTNKVIKSENLLRYYYFAYKIALNINPDFIVAEGGLYDQYQCFTNKFDKSKLYAHLHRVVDGNEKLWKIFPNAIGVSNYVSKKYSAGNNRINVTTVYNCANDKILRRKITECDRLNLMKKLNIDKDDFVIIYAGRLVPEKGVKELAKTVMSINNSKIKLMILGTSLFAEGENTDYTNEIARIAKASNGRIIGTGFVHNNIIANYFAIARLCVVPSMYEEPLALVPLEAMTSGVPVIITNSGGMVEYVKNGYPLVVNRGNMFCEQLVEYILKMYNNPVFCDELKSKGIDRSLDFSRIKFYNDFIKIFDK